ncbi:MAG: hypothetical protein AB7R90_04060 [Reyranellaceae bacterium]
MTPLDVMLGAMRELWARAAALKGRADCAEERLALIRQASAEAHKAAVYVHPRLASIDSADDGDDVGAGRAVSADAGSEDPQRRLGSRELARRLLFAVAFAEELAGAAKPARAEPPIKSREKP